MSTREQIDDWLEDLRVRWIMMDAQQKQALILLTLCVATTLLEVAGTIVKARIGATE